MRQLQIQVEASLRQLEQLDFRRWRAIVRAWLTFLLAGLEQAALRRGTLGTLLGGSARSSRSTESSVLR